MVGLGCSWKRLSSGFIRPPPRVWVDGPPLGGPGLDARMWVLPRNQNPFLFFCLQAAPFLGVPPPWGCPAPGWVSGLDEKTPGGLNKKPVSHLWEPAALGVPGDGFWGL